MTRVSLATLVLVLLASLGASGQASKGESAKRTAIYVTGVDLAGKISNDGKTFVAADDNIWSVRNTDTLKGLEGREAKVKCRMDPERHAIHVLSVVEPEVKPAANLNDSAFRR